MSIKNELNGYGMRILSIYFLIGLFLAFPALSHSANVSIQKGDSKERVLALLGTPTGSVSSDNEETLWFLKGSVQLIDGKVVSIDIISDEALARKEENEKIVAEQIKQQMQLNKKLLEERNAKEKEVAASIAAAKAKEKAEQDRTANQEELKQLLNSYYAAMDTMILYVKKWHEILLSNKSYKEHIDLAPQRRDFRKASKYQLGVCELKLSVIYNFIGKHPEAGQALNIDLPQTRITLDAFKMSIDASISEDDALEKWMAEKARNMESLYERMIVNMQLQKQLNLINLQRQQEFNRMDEQNRQLKSINNKLDDIQRTQQ